MRENTNNSTNKLLNINKMELYTTSFLTIINLCMSPHSDTDTTHSVTNSFTITSFVTPF